MAPTLSLLNPFPNTLPPPTPTPSGGLTLTAPPQTDVYASSVLGHRFSAPIAYTRLPLSTFQRARVTVSAAWTHTFDQGGLILVFPAPGVPEPDAGNAEGQKGVSGADVKGHPRWVKTGVEFVDGRVNVSTVSRDHWADWSLLPQGPGAARKVTVEVEREHEGVVVRIVDAESGAKTMVREVTWALLGPEKEVLVGVYAARPEGSVKDGLEVDYEGFEVWGTEGRVV